MKKMVCRSMPTSFITHRLQAVRDPTCRVVALCEKRHADAVRRFLGMKGPTKVAAFLPEEDRVRLVEQHALDLHLGAQSRLIPNQRCLAGHVAQDRESLLVRRLDHSNEIRDPSIDGQVHNVLSRTDGQACGA